MLHGCRLLLQLLYHHLHVLLVTLCLLLQLWYALHMPALRLLLALLQLW
jgi:hypothetical protein